MRNSVIRRLVGCGAALVIAAGGTVLVLNLASAPQADAENATGQTQNTGHCGTVNGFTVTASHGGVDCGAALAMASAYTAAIMDPDATINLGTGLFWSQEGWSCSRNYDSTGVTINSYGLYCERGGAAVTLVS